MRRAVLLDRDGTLIEDAGYLDRLDRFVLFPFTVDAVRLLNRAGFAVVVATNQSGVARGFFDEAFVDDVRRHLENRLMAGGARLDGYYYCPHHPDSRLEAYRLACECRKPQAGLFRRAARDLDLDLARSFVVGDKWHDLEAGRAVGARGVLVRTGYGRAEESSRRDVPAAAVTDNLIEAVSWILRHQ